MFKKSLSFFLLGAVAVFLLTGATSCSIFKKSSRARVKVLMVSSNTFEARLLCELAQYRNKQPVILYDASRSSFYYLSGTTAAEPVALEQFADFVQFQNPRQVIILGDSNYVPAEYVKQIANDFSVMTIQSEDWYKNAQQLAEVLNLNRLPREFKDTRDRYIRSGLVRPGEKP
jgi:hypothetical protein